MQQIDFNNNEDLEQLFEKVKKLYGLLGESFMKELNRLPAFTDMLVNRWEKGRILGFGEGSNIYDNALVIGDVNVGKECWVGPNTILDGSGSLTIGNYCTISSGVHIYTHDNVKQTLSSKQLPIERKPTSIGNNVYIGPHAVITKGVTIGDFVIIGSFAFVNRNVAKGAIMMGQPAKQVGSIEQSESGEINYKYF